MMPDISNFHINIFQERKHQCILAQQTIIMTFDKCKNKIRNINKTQNKYEIGMDTKVIESIVKVAEEQGWIDKLIDYFSKKHKIIILGCSGAGKTELIKSIESLNPEIIHYASRTRDKAISKIKINKVLFEFIDLPGEEQDLSIRNQAILEHIKELDAVINVTSYGYHEYTYGKDDAIIKGDMISDDYLEDNRKRELDTLHEWSISLGGERSYRLITVVTKADLWWPDRKDVITHYESGEYFKALGGAKRLRPMVVPYCSVIKKFYDEAPTSGKIDGSDCVRFRSDLLRILVEVVGKGGNGK